MNHQSKEMSAHICQSFFDIQIDNLNRDMQYKGIEVNTELIEVIKATPN